MSKHSKLFFRRDKEGVGNSKIGFLNIDPNVKPEKIAGFINNKAKGLLS